MESNKANRGMSDSDAASDQGETFSTRPTADTAGPLPRAGSTCNPGAVISDAY